MPNTFEDLQTRQELSALVNLPSKRQMIIDETSAIIDSGSPFMAAGQMMNLSNFLPSQVKQEMLGPLIEKCLTNADPVIRWSGIFAAYALEDGELVRRSLENDHRSLLIRPDPAPWWAAAWWREEQNWFNRLNAAVTVASLRGRLIEMIGEYGIEEAKPVLSAIISDKAEWLDGLKEQARESLEALEQRNTGPPR